MSKTINLTPNFGSIYTNFITTFPAEAQGLYRTLTTNEQKAKLQGLLASIAIAAQSLTKLDEVPLLRDKTEEAVKWVSKQNDQQEVFS